MRKRLFIGTLLAPQQRQEIVDLRAELDPIFARCWENCRLRWVAPEKLHITWLFAGDCDSEKEAELRKFLDNGLAEINAFQIRYEQIEIFGSNSNRPTAIVLAPELVGKETQVLGNLMRESVGHLCQKKPDLLFRPHLTLLRFPRDYRADLRLNKEQMELAKFLPLTQAINSISLIESHMGSEKDHYEILSEIQLTATRLED